MVKREGMTIVQMALARRNGYPHKIAQLSASKIKSYNKVWATSLGKLTKKQKKKRYPYTGYAWSQPEIEFIVREWQKPAEEKEKWRAIAKIVGRSEQACRLVHHKFGKRGGTLEDDEVASSVSSQSASTMGMAVDSAEELRDTAAAALSLISDGVAAGVEGGTQQRHDDTLLAAPPPGSSNPPSALLQDADEFSSVEQEHGDALLTAPSGHPPGTPPFAIALSQMGIGHDGLEQEDSPLLKGSPPSPEEGLGSAALPGSTIPPFPKAARTGEVNEGDSSPTSLSGGLPDTPSAAFQTDFRERLDQISIPPPPPPDGILRDPERYHAELKIWREKHQLGMPYTAPINQEERDNEWNLATASSLGFYLSEHGESGGTP